ncbi:MAG: amino acid ABC transporter substrate-binding protein [Saprospirales bacterium]|nr:amino acid ABC transporter substrate-binding protein [Saprospirales bacterium]
MISAPNRHRQLNGNSRSWLFVLILSLAFASCDLFKKLPDDSNKPPKEDDLGEIQPPTRVDPETGELIPVTVLVEKMDTVKWKELSTDRFPPITSIGDDQLPDPLTGDLPGLPTVTGAGPKVALMLPFMTDRFNAASPSFFETSKWAIHYYCGVKLAAEDLEKEGISLHIDVFDSKASEDEVSQLLNTDSRLAKADLIIGPYRSSNVRMVAEVGKRNEIPIVSPYSAATGIADENPYYIQVNPSLKAHCTAITRQVRERYETEQVVLVVRNKPEELSRLAFFQEANREFFTHNDTARFQQYIVSDNSADFNSIDVTPYLQSDQKVVFVVPSWENESFIYSLLRKIKLAKSDLSDVVVYGMPRWMDYEQIMDYDLYEDLNVHVSSSFFADDLEENVKNFNRRYFDAYGELPQEEAFIGYEVLRYFVHQIMREGDRFLERLDSKDEKNLYTTYQFRKVVDMPMVSDDFRRRFGRLENEYVHILEFRDFHFQIAAD